MSSRNNPARVAIVMGSKSDWATMQFAAEIFEILDVPHHVEVVSAHRTPDKLFSFAETAEENGYQVIIAGAGGAAHLPGMIAAKTLVPVLGVPVQSAALSGVDSLYSIVQMPRGIPVGTLAIGKAGAANAALLAAQILAQHDAELHQRIADWRKALMQFWKIPIRGGRYEASLRSRQRATGPNAAPGGRTAGYRRLAGWSGCRAYRRAGTAERHYRRD
ncbi:phosphoribosylaminoimidazole carboxylase catalytic subunit [Salmonella enterica subsp. enterica serovar Heidelberg str. 29169]|nr:phosphoribosylaminoimidazole carboxylase catalytic subunit [Salmonella enterica subsp. enterica serovar Heidelberg str. 29169]